MKPVLKLQSVQSMLACFCAVQSGALVVCVGTMIVGSGALAGFEGIGVWVFSQFFVLPLAVVVMPVGAKLRMRLARVLENLRPVALIAGTLIGCTGGGLIAAYIKDPITNDYLLALAIGGTVGLIGGWVWWRVEQQLEEGFAY